MIVIETAAEVDPAKAVSPLYTAVMLSVCGGVTLFWLHPEMPATALPRISRPAKAYPRRLASGRRFNLNRYAIASAPKRIQTGCVPKGGIWGGAAGGVRNDRVGLRVAVQKAVAPPAPAVGVQVAGARSVLVPFMNCTVPVGPAPLLVVVTLAVSVTVPPEVILDAELVRVVKVARPVIVNVTAGELLALKLASPL